MKKLFLISFILCYHFGIAQNISVHHQLKSQITDASIYDFCQLLKSAGLKVLVNSTEETIHFKIEKTKVEILDEKTKEDFEWKVNKTEQQITFTCSSVSEKGISNGLYSFLQEKLGFQFYHPKKTIIPNLKKFDFSQLKKFSAKKSFQHIGFHLHTMHPIELTEDLLDEKRENGLSNVLEYIDWLARNGQNYFEFNLLEGIKKKNWIAHAKKITNYAHARGIQVGVDISLHMLQQKAFQLYKSFSSSFGSKSSQIKKNAKWLLSAGFDVWNIELSATEFTGGNAEKKSKLLEELQTYVGDQVKIMSRSHVVKSSEMLDKKHVLKLPAKHGLMVHTVMFYGLTDSIAPVYRNKNLLHMQELLEKTRWERETWYYPESAYWVTFDSSIPMLLMPYFESRLKDIELCAEKKIEGHLTFSSGWEWGYWAIDWSIARWCWRYYSDDQLENQSSTQYISSISNQESIKKLITEQEKLQLKYIKNQELIRVLDAQTVTDETIKPLNIEFHPRPKYAYKYIRNQATLAELDTVKTLYLNPLTDFIKLSQQTFKYVRPITEEEKEIVDALKMTELRARHKQKTLQYLVEFRENKIKHQKKKLFMNDAVKIRKEALAIVKRREEKYRYSAKELTTKHKDHTAYHFGYLYTVHQLHFWEREEKQAQKNKYKVRFMNIWNVFRIIGIIN